jgi:hypothetical protein
MSFLDLIKKQYSKENTKLVFVDKSENLMSWICRSIQLLPTEETYRINTSVAQEV